MRVSVALVVLGLMSGCTTFRTQSEFLTTTPTRPAVAPDHVEVIFSGRVDRTYREHGVAVVVGQRWLGSGPGKPIASLTLADLVAELRSVGASHGCDALLVNPETSGRPGVTLSATCIVYP